MTAANSTAFSEKKPIDYASEVRFGVVMYGGVSLAIYINGAANEMYEMTCATPKFTSPQQPPNTSTANIDTREIYRRLSLLANNPALRAAYYARLKDNQAQPDGQLPKDAWEEPPSAGLNRTRLVVDVIAGTSAGGINGIFLAKALVSGGPFFPLKDLWINEGDLGRLLNDRRSYDGLNIPGSDIRDKVNHPKSLLNSDRMYLKLFEAMEKINPDVRTHGAEMIDAAVDEMDLFITTTDIAGSPVPLRLSDQLVYERRHKQNFHFIYSQGTHGRNDFVRAKDALLSFAARCTSSFPFAFEPMTVEAVRHLKPTLANDVATDLPKVFSYLSKSEEASGKHVWRASGDGGYLDNKPFTYVAQTLSIRQANVPVERKLIYVEPAPQSANVDEAPTADTELPDALSNSLAALTSIPRYETIREDLQAVLHRNRSIERVDRIVRESAIDLHTMLKGISNPFVRILTDEKSGQIPPWPEFPRKKMVRYYGTAFLAYRRVRVSSVTDKLGEHLARLWDIDTETDHLYALTAWVREWRNSHYKEDPKKGDRRESINAFLDLFDVDYRIRRLSFLLRRLDHLKGLIDRWRHAELTPYKFALLPEADKQIITRLKLGQMSLFQDHMDSDAADRAIAALNTLKRQLNDVQAEWRIAERKGRHVSSKNAISDKQKHELNMLILLLLGAPPNGVITLTREDGEEVLVQLTEKTLGACACSRTMQDSVVARAKDVVSAAGGLGEIALYKALDNSIDQLSVKSKDMRGAWHMLGEPTLELVPPRKKTVSVIVKDMHDSTLDTKEGKLMRSILGEYYVYFDLFDQMSFPLYHDANIGEPSTVEVVRISPEDAHSLVYEQRDSKHKLAGTALFNFGAFIEKSWRLNDFMWGRLDGAERLIQTLLPLTDTCTEAVRKELIDQAHRAILRETFKQAGAAKVAYLLGQALAEVPEEGDIGKRIHNLLERIIPGKSQRHTHLAAMLIALLSEQDLIDHVKTCDIIKPDPKATLDNASRAVTITGRVLDEIGKQKGKKSIPIRWLTRAGLMFQGLLAVSLPGSLEARWWAHLMGLLYLFEIVGVVSALLFAPAVVYSFAWKMLVLTLLAHATILILGDLLQSQTGWLKKGKFCAMVLVVALAGVGGLALYNDVPWRAWLYGEEVVANASSATAYPSRHVAHGSR